MCRRRSLSLRLARERQSQQWRSGLVFQPAEGLRARELTHFHLAAEVASLVTYTLKRIGGKSVLLIFRSAHLIREIGPNRPKFATIQDYLPGPLNCSNTVKGGGIHNGIRAVSKPRLP